jgi:phospholipase C
MPKPLVLALAALLFAVPLAGAPAAVPRPPNFRHVVVIVMENKEYERIIGNKNAPTFNRLARRYASLTDFYGVAKPSLPNYLALVSGSTHGITANCTDCEIDAPSLADTLPAAGKTWKAYAQGLPYPGFAGAQAGLYVKKHNPFPYFRSVAASPARMRRIVPLGQFGRDLEARKLPDFSLVVPDLCDGMHDCSVRKGDRWLAAFLEPLLESPEMAGSLVVVTFDEGDTAVRGGGHIATLLLGPLVRPGARNHTTLDHYSLLRTIEDAWKVPRLGKSATAVPVRGIWRR